MMKTVWQGEVLASDNGMGYCLRYRLDGGLMYMEVNRKRIPAAKLLAGRSVEDNAGYFLKEHIRQLQLLGS